MIILIINLIVIINFIKIIFITIIILILFFIRVGEPQCTFPALTHLLFRQRFTPGEQKCDQNVQCHDDISDVNALQVVL